jgi:hypothetical protein
MKKEKSGRKGDTLLPLGEGGGDPHPFFIKTPPKIENPLRIFLGEIGKPDTLFRTLPA